MGESLTAAELAGLFSPGAASPRERAKPESAQKQRTYVPRYDRCDRCRERVPGLLPIMHKPGRVPRQEWVCSFCWEEDDAAKE